VIDLICFSGGSHEEEEEAEIVPKRSTQTESQVSGEEREEGSQEGAEDEGEQGNQEVDQAEEEEQGFLGMAIQGLFGGASGSPIGRNAKKMMK